MVQIDSLIKTIHCDLVSENSFFEVSQRTRPKSEPDAAFAEMAFEWDATPPSINAGPDVFTNIPVNQDATSYGAETFQWQKISRENVKNA